LNLENVKWIRVNTHVDERGSLSAVESHAGVPFEIKRIFYMHNIVAGEDRGGHAHQETDQYAIALHGSMKVFLPKLTWTDLYDFSDDAVCLVLASTHYDRSKSLRTWTEYLKARNFPILPLPDRGAALMHP
jgi:hypothetical protein